LTSSSPTSNMVTFSRHLVSYLPQVDFLTETIFGPIESLFQAGDRLAIGGSRPRRLRDLIARRRLHWIAEVLTKRVQEYFADPTVDSSSEFISSVRDQIQKWRFVSLPELFDRLNSDLQYALLGELTEEMLYQARSNLPNPLDQRMWSNLAVDLTIKVVHSVAKYLCCYPRQNETRKQHLGEDLLTLARDAAESVRNGTHAINNLYKDHSIPSTATDKHIKSFSFKPAKQTINEEILLDKSKEKMISVYDAKSTIHFGTAAAMADIQAYYDATELCGIESHYIPGKTRRVSKCNCSIVSQYEPECASNIEKRSPQFYWMSRSIDAFKNGNARVNEQWYLVNQVLTVVHVLASTLVDWSGSDGEHANNGYSLEKLCKMINLDLNDAKRALSRGAVRPTWPEQDVITAHSPALSEVGPTNRPVRRCHKPRHRTSASSRQHGEVYKGTDPEFPGWTIQHFQRTNSVRVDYYWSHPEIQGVLLKSKKTLQMLVNYTKTKCVGLQVAYEMHREMKSLFMKAH